MSLSASEFFEAGMSLPPSVREDVAIRLLESLEVAGQESVDESWTAEIGSRVDEMVGGEAQMVPGEAVFAELADRRAARQGARDA
ncbi:putative addiction module component, TIGR02574 family [Aeromicrobium marinum DSM 15272]|uniref:Addiction module component, TIGR02574 family n=1 Tax=Aeromicrobium marinum DSM 15272 TaxID=585531 RepID=E2S8B9_9ACTN|nr:addiction module protein [Aeromicrobium marinum]EFQ84424.1 putative addiction module component, TIGR02574 family [Aeromicrobium marinum DSM 15272]